MGVSRRALIEATTYGEPNAYVDGNGIPESEMNITAFDGPSEQDIIEACRLKATFSDPYMAPPVLDDIDCDRVTAFSKEEPASITLGYQQPSASKPSGPHHPHHFIHDKHCITGMAIKGTVDPSRSGADATPSACPATSPCCWTSQSATPWTPASSAAGPPRRGTTAAACALTRATSSPRRWEPPTPS